ncbi:MAG: FUSC family protein, partial [Burkholderiales bacterium]|nr:FUSC family protein [Burkholderiales bacterium]
MSLARRIPDYVLNGATVAAGVGLIQLVVGAAAGPHVAQLALSGAVCTSLADVPNTVPRTWQRVSAAALLSFITAVVVAALKLHPQLLGLGVAGVAFCAMMTMAWGLRAAAVAFAPVLSLVFSMAVPEGAGSPWLSAGCNAMGALAYLGWSLAVGLLMAPRYRTLALVRTLRAVAQLLASRAAVLESDPSAGGAERAMKDWILGENVLADRLQTARDFVFAEADSPGARRHAAMLLRAIELRDALLASRIDLELLGSDPPALWVLQRVATTLRGFGSALEASADALQFGQRPQPHPPQDLRRLFDQAPFAAGDERARLLPALQGRLGDIASNLARIDGLLAGVVEELPLTREQLHRFVAPEGWPPAALRAEFNGQSPVLRHAVRTALALTSAYYIAIALPWTSHPHWLVLSVAVVLRGNLEQTISRRNARVFGTVLGCLVVTALSHFTLRGTQGAFFLLAVGTGHAFVAQRYWLTATAATVMALLQSHMVDPANGFAIAERLADTVLGAALAWAFSYVLPAWERRRLPRAVERVLAALRDYAGQALDGQRADAVEQRLARRRGYDALGALAASLQRSRFEPRQVQVPVPEVAA